MFTEKNFQKKNQKNAFPDIAKNHFLLYSVSAS